MFKNFVHYGAILEEVLHNLMVLVSFFCLVLFPFVVLYHTMLGHMLISAFYMLLTTFFAGINVLLNRKGR